MAFFYIGYENSSNQNISKYHTLIANQTLPIFYWGWYDPLKWDSVDVELRLTKLTTVTPGEQRRADEQLMTLYFPNETESNFICYKESDD